MRVSPEDPTMNERLAISRIGGVALARAMSDVERRLRIELAAVFRVAHHLDWNYDTLNHITVRSPGADALLMNPAGLGWDEITASSLATVDFEGNILSHAGLRLAPAGYNFHSGLMKARSDINCVIHTHEHAGVIVSATGGELPVISQGGCRLHGEVGLHAFEGLAKESEEVPRIVRDLGARHTLIMLNHGLLAVGETLGAAFGWMRTLTDECRLVERALATGRKITPVPEELQIHTKGQMGGGKPGPRDDHSWQYWLRLAERLDPGFAD
jgi:ribulose-5-phosphate 4-epimerase/fuculose-1-phosphate aldolase